MFKPVVLIMAAGQSRRFGSNNKLLHPLHDGRPILSHTLDIYQSLNLSVHVITRPDDEGVHQLLKSLGIPAIINHQAHLGLGHSIAKGITETNRCDGWLITLGDMPFLSPDTVQQVVAGMQSDRIVRPTYKHQPGHPVGFGSAFQQELQSLTGDQGAKALLEKHHHKVTWISVKDPMIIRDIDTSADL